MGAITIFLVVLVLLSSVALYRFYRSRNFQRIVLYDYQRGVAYRKGVFDQLLGPGTYRTSVSRTITPVDLRKQLLAMPGQEIHTTDGISVKVSAVVEYSVTDPVLMQSSSTGFYSLLYAYAQQSVRMAVSELAFENLLSSRIAVASRSLELMAPRAAALGISVASAEVNDIMLPAEIRRANAQAITARKEGLAALERARGETAALRSLSNAARLTQEHPGLLHLRALQKLEGSKGNAKLEIRFEEPSRDASGVGRG